MSIGSASRLLVAFLGVPALWRTKHCTINIAPHCRDSGVPPKKTARRVVCLPALAYALGSLLVAMAALHVNAAQADVFAGGNVFVPPSFLCPLNNQTYRAGGIGRVSASGSATVDQGGLCGVFGFSSASADEAKGQLRVLDQALEGEGREVRANSEALIRTGIHLFGPADATHVTDTLDMVVTGFGSPWSTVFGPPFATSSWRACISVTFGEDETPKAFSSGCSNSGVHTGDGKFFNFTETLTIDVPVVLGAADPIEVDFFLSSTARFVPVNDIFGVPGIVDISHTAQIRQTLPPGWTFTSDSGVFLTESESSLVPQPATALLIGIGLAYLTFLGLARRNRTDSCDPHAADDARNSQKTATAVLPL